MSMDAQERQAVNRGSVPAETDFEQVFKSRFRALHVYAASFVGDPDLAEDMVQAAFCKLWEKYEDLEVRHSLTAYLYRSVYHECLNHLKHLKVRESHAAHARRRAYLAEDTPAPLEASELEDSIRRALEALPEGCRTIFQMSRFESLKYQEIADRLQLSVKTVENQMGKALKILRARLAEYLPLLVAFFFLHL